MNFWKYRMAAAQQIKERLDVINNVHSQLRHVLNDLDNVVQELIAGLYILDHLDERFFEAIRQMEVLGINPQLLPQPSHTNNMPLHQAYSPVSSDNSPQEPGTGPLYSPPYAQPSYGTGQPTMPTSPQYSPQSPSFTPTQSPRSPVYSSDDESPLYSPDPMYKAINDIPPLPKNEEE